MRDQMVLLACGVFRDEYERLPCDLRGRFEAVFFDSLLHMRPMRLDEEIGERLRAETRPAVLLFGDCSPHMREHSARPRTVRVEGVNCAALSLGAERYRALQREGCFFFMPEWTGRWREVFETELGLGSAELAKDFMRATKTTQLVYVDDGGEPPPVEALEEASRHLGVPFRIERCSAAALEKALLAALARLP